MAVGSESGVEMVGPEWEVGPMEDVVQALMEALVDPFLPLRISNVPPSEDVQKSIAKQMHAVVLLYNYHHRKQKPDLVFLNFLHFCKLAMVFRPPLIPFMKLMKESEPVEPNGAEDQLSVTEKAIKDACNISLALDASRDVPNSEGWPISKVGVLLIDSKKKNCMLQLGAVTEGAWSLIEKELNESSINPEISVEEKVGNKRKQNNQYISTYDSTEILQLAYDAVKDVTGIESSDLEVFESHITYSLSKEKSATRFYMMQCSGSIKLNEQVPLNFLAESLRGPLAEKLNYDIWKATPIVNFHYLLPYAEFISHWLSRIKSCLPSLRNCNAQKVMNGCVEPTQNSKNGILESLENESEQPDMDLLLSPASHPSQAVVKEVGQCDAVDPAVIEVRKNSIEISDNFNEKHNIAHSVKVETRVHPEILDEDSVKCDEDTSQCSSRGLKVTMIDSTNIFKKNEDSSEKPNSEIRGYYRRRKTNTQLQNDASSLKVELVDSWKPDPTQHKDEKVSGDEGDVSNTCNQTVDSTTMEQPDPMEATIKSNEEVQDALASDQLQDALALLYSKREELYSRICYMEDTLASCEDNIARIRDGSEVELARQCINSVLQQSEENRKYQQQKPTRLSESYFLGKSSCQDLEYTCMKNNWKLPRYLTESSDGKFMSNVVIEAKDFKLDTKGSFESKPSEARNSAAAQMIAILQKHYDEANLA